VHVYKIIKQLFQGTVKTIDPRTVAFSCLFREQSKLLSLGAGDDLGTVAFGLRHQFSSHLQHLGSIVLTVP
jgi:hypothetical protein